MPVAEFHYRFGWRARGAFPGGHAGSHRGSGYEVARFSPLYAAVDPRRFDVRASLRDPFGRIVARVYNQLSAVPVHGLADVSGSMGFRGRSCKWDVLADFAASLVLSAHRSGDSVAFTACDTDIRPELTFAKTRDRGLGLSLRERLRTFTPCGTGSEGLLAAAERLPPRRGLVFLISDFHFPTDLLTKILSRLSMHYVVPVVLWDSAEAQVPRFGIARLLDPESGASRTMLVRAALGSRLRNACSDTKKTLIGHFAKFGLTPLIVIDRFDADAVTRYFHG